MSSDEDGSSSDSEEKVTLVSTSSRALAAPTYSTANELEFSDESQATLCVDGHALYQTDSSDLELDSEETYAQMLYNQRKRARMVNSWRTALGQPSEDGPQDEVYHR